MRRRRGEEGLTATQLAVVMPALLFWISLTVQYGLWFHARQVAGAAAAEGVDAGQVAGAGAGDAEAAARSFLAQAGNLRDAEVVVTSAGGDVTVRVSGRAPRLVPGFDWGVTAVATSPLERFVPEPLRPAA